MRKRDELNNPAGCMARARDDEMVFVLLGRDEDAPDTIWDWIARRIRRGKNRPDDAQILEAARCALIMEAEREPKAAGLDAAPAGEGEAMTGPTLTGLDLVRDQLSEAQRYTRSDPAAAKSPLMHATLDLTVDELWKDTRHAALVRRIAENLLIGAGCISAAPDVTEAYITGALWELGDLASRLRKDAEAEERDAELLEGYGPKGEGLDHDER
jgi:hypothetical protein